MKNKKKEIIVIKEGKKYICTPYVFENFLVSIFRNLKHLLSTFKGVCYFF